MMSAAVQTLLGLLPVQESSVQIIEHWGLLFRGIWIYTFPGNGMEYSKDEIISLSEFRVIMKVCLSDSGIMLFAIYPTQALKIT